MGIKSAVRNGGNTINDISAEIIKLSVDSYDLLHFVEYRIETHTVNRIMHRPEMKNQTFTPTFSAIGLLKSKPIGIVTEEIKVSTENALPIFFGDMVSCI